MIPLPPSPPALAPHLAITVEHAGRPERMVCAAAAGGPLPATEGWLDPRELARIDRAVERRRREFVLGRLAAKTALAVWHDHAALGAFAIVPGAFEQPVVLGNSAADVTLAHATGAAVAVAHERGHPVGVDLETIDPQRLGAVRSEVAAAELPPRRGAATDETVGLFLIWSAKEALSKALRCGLTCPFALLAVADPRLDDAGVCAGTFAHFGQYQFVAWPAGTRTFALACSRNARLEPALPALVRFTRESLAAPA